jgi:hypothetical protein
MKYEANESAADECCDHQGTGASEAMLRAEIGFWRGLLNSCDQAVPVESVERMEQALALAELRLLQLYGGEEAGRASCSGPVRTSRPVTKSLH